MWMYTTPIVCIGIVGALGRMWCSLREDRQCRHLQWLYIGVGCVHLISSLIIAGLFSRQTEQWLVPLYLHLEFEQLHQMSVPVASCTVVFGVLCGMGHLISATWRPRVLQHYIEKGNNLYRWCEYALSSSLMVVVIGCLCGVNNLYVITGMAVVQGYTMFQSHFIERQWADTYFTQDNLFYSGLYAFGTTTCVYIVGVWVPIWGYFYPTLSRSSAPEWVYSMVWILFGLFALFPGIMVYYLVLTAHSSTPSNLKTRHMVKQELAYVSLSLISKLTLQWILYMGIHNQTNTQTHNNPNIGLIASTVGIIGCIIYSVGRVYVLRAYPHTPSNQFLF
jgi:hypothetical protein